MRAAASNPHDECAAEGFDFTFDDDDDRHPGERFKFVCDGPRLLAAPAPDGDYGVMHADLITEMEAKQKLAGTLQSVILGWIWVQEPDAVYELAYGHPDGELELLLLRWLEDGRPSPLAPPSDNRA